MTINSRLPVYKEEISNIVDDNYKRTRALVLTQRAFSDGVLSIMSAGSKSKTKGEAVQKLNENLSDYYIDKNIDNLYEYFLNIIKSVSNKGKLVVGYEDSAKEDFKSIIKAVYDMGLIAGVEVAKDPTQLEIFLKNKENIESGQY
jgi:hypothetical protein